MPGGLPQAFRHYIRQHHAPVAGGQAPDNNCFLAPKLRERYPEHKDLPAIQLCVTEVRKWAAEHSRTDILDAVPPYDKDRSSPGHLPWVRFEAGLSEMIKNDKKAKAEKQAQHLQTVQQHAPELAALLQVDLEELAAFARQEAAQALAQQRGAPVPFCLEVLEKCADDIDKAESALPLVMTLRNDCPSVSVQACLEALEKCGGDAAAAKADLDVVVANSFMEIDSPVYNSMAMLTDDTADDGSDAYRSLGPPPPKHKEKLNSLCEKLKAQAEKLGTEVGQACEALRALLLDEE